jgi:hypothetical protein
MPPFAMTREPVALSVALGLRVVEHEHQRR